MESYLNYHLLDNSCNSGGLQSFNNSIKCFLNSSKIKGLTMSLELIKAAKDNDIKAFNEHLSKPNINFNLTDSNNQTVLMHACTNGNVEMVTALLAKKVDVKYKNKENFTAFHAACSGGNEKVFTLLLNTNEVEFDQADLSGWTPLCHATFSSHTPIIARLLSLKADANHITQWSDSPLILAASTRNPKAVSLLLAAGAKVDHRGMAGSTALLTAIEVSRNPLKKEISTNERKQVIFLLLKNKADVSIPKNTEVAYKDTSWDVPSYSALMIASEQGETDIVEELLKSGAETNFTNDAGENALKVAIVGRVGCKHQNVGPHLEVISLLLKWHADPEKTGDSLFTNSAKALASQLERNDIVKLFENHKSKLHAENSVLSNSLLDATLKKQAQEKEKIDGYEKQRAKIHSLFEAATKNDVNTIEMLAKEGLDVNSCYIGGHTALHYACKTGSIQAILCLEKHGGDVNRLSTSATTDAASLFTKENLALYQLEKKKRTEGSTPSQSVAAAVSTISASGIVMPPPSVATTLTTITDSPAAEPKTVENPTHKPITFAFSQSKILKKNEEVIAQSGSVHQTVSVKK